MTIAIRIPGHVRLTDAELTARLFASYTGASPLSDRDFLALVDEAGRRRAPHLVMEAYRQAFPRRRIERAMTLDDDERPRFAEADRPIYAAIPPIVVGGQGRTPRDLTSNARALAVAVVVLGAMAGVAAVVTMAVQAVLR